MQTALTSASYPQHLHQLSDKALIERYQEAKTDEILAEHCFNLLYSRYAPALWNYIRYKVSNREDAEDIFVESWRIAIEELSTLTLKSSFRSWLLGIARNVIAAYYPRRKSGSNPATLLQPGSRCSAPADYSLDELLTNLDGDLSPLIEVALHDQNEANDPVLANLRQEEKAVFLNRVLPVLRERSPAGFAVIYLAYFAELSNREIAVELNRSEGAIKTAKSRAHVYLAQILRELLDQMDEDPDWFE